MVTPFMCPMWCLGSILMSLCPAIEGFGSSHHCLEVLTTTQPPEAASPPSPPHLWSPVIIEQTPPPQEPPCTDLISPGIKKLKLNNDMTLVEMLHEGNYLAPHVLECRIPG